MSYQTPDYKIGFVLGDFVQVWVNLSVLCTSKVG